MALNPADFGTFMQEAYGFGPFPWQQRLLDYILHNGHWPELIAAPTGAGKSTVIDIHVFLNALAQQDGLSLPRRLVMTVNRRNLIDDHAAHAERLRERLMTAGPGSLLERIRQLLEQRSNDGAALIVPVIRGGLPLQNDWRTQPLTTAVIAATPDMWGSRVLFRGYGTARHSRSLEAGLLSRDCVLIVDESHLNRQLITTARRIRELDSVGTEQLGVPLLQVVETTATPASSGNAQAIQVTESDLRESATLNARLTTPKPVELRQLTVKRKQAGALAQEFVDAALELQERFQDAQVPIGIIVNTIELAALIHAELRKRLAAEDGDRILALLGAQRLFDRAEVQRQLTDTERYVQLQFIVATQTLEVGVDIDLAALVSELAPASAVVQRSGRVNRVGARQDAQVLVLQPTYEKAGTGTPYSHDELNAAAEWLATRSDDLDGLAPWALLADPPPVAEPSRLLWQRPEWPDIQFWSRTSENLAVADRSLVPGGEDLTLWLRDDFSATAEASLVIRSFLSLDFLQNTAVIRLTPPLSEEVFPVPLYRLKDISETLLKRLEGRKQPAGHLIVLRDGEPLLLSESTSGQALSWRELRAGDTLVLRDTDRVLLSGLVPHRAGNETGSDVYDEIMRSSGRLHHRALLQLTRDGTPTQKAEQVAHQAATALLESDTDPDADRETLRNDLLAALDELFGLDAGSLAELANLTLELVPSVTEDGPLFVLVSTAEPADEQYWQTSGSKRVLLTDHQADVAAEARLNAELLGLGDLAASLELAGLHHDEGKREARFQEFLRGRSVQPDVLAKSGSRVSDRRRWLALGLSGWRHEQLSAAWVWADDNEAVASERALIAWLIGTSHGRGRTVFDSGSATLLSQPEGMPAAVVAAAQELYDSGAWDDLFEALSLRFGPWGLAYLEAVLRTADQRVSARGH